MTVSHCDTVTPRKGSNARLGVLAPELGEDGGTVLAYVELPFAEEVGGHWAVWADGVEVSVKSRPVGSQLVRSQSVRSQSVRSLSLRSQSVRSQSVRSQSVRRQSVRSQSLGASQ